MGWLLHMVRLVIFLLDFLSFNTVHHVRTHCGVKSVAIIGKTITIVVAAGIKGWAVRLVVLLIRCVESVLIVNEDFRISCIVLVLVFKTFLLSLCSVYSGWSMLGKIH